jgi:hypothetical protein
MEPCRIWQAALKHCFRTALLIETDTILDFRFWILDRGIVLRATAPKIKIMQMQTKNGMGIALNFRSYITLRRGFTRISSYPPIR